jgi:hypothetical protein
MNTARIVVLNIVAGTGATAASPASGSDDTLLPTDSVNVVRYGATSPTATQK